MKKLILLVIIVSSWLYSYTYDDYQLFLKGKGAYEKEKYSDAKDYFEQFMRTFGDSTIIRNNYAYYYIGATYYRMGDLENASFYLEKAVFSLKSTIFRRSSFDERSRFYMMRDFMLGEIFLKLGDNEKSITYFKRLEYNVSTVITSGYEKRALELIKGKDDVYDRFYRLKFNDEFSLIGDFDTKTLTSIGNYFVTTRDYDKAIRFYDLILRSRRLNSEERITLESSMLQTMLRAGKNTDVVSFSSNRQGSRSMDHIYYYLGRAYQNMGKFNDAVAAYDKVKGGSNYERARIQIAGILFSIKKYNEVIEICQRLTGENFFSLRMITNSYLELGDKKNFKSSAENFIERYPNTYDSMLFYYYLNNKYDANSDKNTLLQMGIVIDNYIKDLKPTLNNLLKESERMEIEKIKKVSDFKDEDLIKIEIDNSSFVIEKSVENGYAITTVLENGGFYALAYRNSDYYKNQFFKHSDTIELNYPKYYQNIVERYAKQYDIQPILIYSIINIMSRFDNEHVSEDSGVGLMGIAHDRGSLETLTDPEKNIELGCQRLKTILNENNGNFLKSIISYVNGRSYLEKLNFDRNNNLNLDSIIDPRERYELQELLITYILYSKLY